MSQAIWLALLSLSLQLSFGQVMLRVPVEGTISDTTARSWPLNLWFANVVTQSLYTVNDLGRAGIYPGSQIMQTWIYSPGTARTVADTRSYIKFTSTMALSNLTTVHETGWTLLRETTGNRNTPQNGWFDMGKGPWTWNGVSNVLYVISHRVPTSSDTGGTRIRSAPRYACQTKRYWTPGVFPFDSNTVLSSMNQDTQSALLMVQMDVKIPNQYQDATDIVFGDVVTLPNPGFQYFWTQYRVTLPWACSALVVKLINLGNGTQNLFIHTSMPAWETYTSSAAISTTGSVSVPSPSSGSAWFIGIQSEFPSGFTIQALPPEPVLISVTPVSVATTGARITISGTDLGDSSRGSVTVGGTTCTVSSWSTSSIVCTAPAGEGLDAPVVLTLLGQSSNVLTLDYNPPSITSITPTSGATDSAVIITITGNNFGINPSVFVRGNPCPISGLTSATSVRCVVPSGPGTDNRVVVTVAGRNATSTAFSYTAPAITGVAPSTLPGSIVTLTGTSFGDSGQSVTISGLDCPIVEQTHRNTLCRLPSPTLTSTQSVILSRGGQSSAAFSYTFAAPVLTSITPTTSGVQGGANLTLIGNFYQGGSVLIGTFNCPIVFSNATLIVCRIPAGLGGNLDVRFRTADSTPRTTAALKFSYDAPVILSASGGPTAGGVSTTLTGINFGSPATVTIGGSSCSVTFVNSTVIVCTLPAGQGTAVTTVVSVASQTNSVPFFFHYNSPSISGFTPLSATTAGNIRITVSGINFGLTPSVQVGGVNCPSVTVNHTQVTCTLAAGQGTGLPVTITVIDQTATAVNNFNYDGPNIATITPTTGPTAGITITLTGINFGLNGIVSIDNSSCAILTWSHTSITCTTPGLTSPAAAVRVFVGGTRVSNIVNFAYNPPSISSVSPLSAATDGGSSVQLTGLNFGSIAGAVSIGSFPCNVVSWSHTAITCTLSAGAGSGLTAQVTQGTVDARVATRANSFSYTAPFINSIGPAAPTGGAPVTITGTSFGPTGFALVFFNIQGTLQPCSIVTQTHTNIVCNAPAGQGVVTVTISVAGQNATTTFTYQSPSISNIRSNSSFIGNDPITITGQNFGISPIITINNLTCPIVTFNHTQIICNTPTGNGKNLPLIIIVGSQSVSINTFSYSDPVVNNFFPSTGSTQGQYNLTLQGWNFGSLIVGTTTVTVRAISCPIVTYSNTTIVCTMPVGSGTSAPVIFRYNAVHVANTVLFNYSPPSVSSVTPNSGTTAGGYNITLRGDSFGVDLAQATVTLSANRVCTLNFINHTTIICLFPAGDHSYSQFIRITVNGQATNWTTFQHSAPTISSINPANGPTLGGLITVNGDSLGLLLGGGSVTVGGFDCPITSWVHTAVVCTVVSGQGANLSVVLSTQNFTAATSWGYNAPSLSAVTPASADPGTLIQIDGADFGTSGTVLIGGVVCVTTNITGALYSQTSIRCQVPNWQGAGLSLVLTVSGQSSNSLTFSYPRPTIQNLIPSNGPTSGGTNVTVVGTGFGTNLNLIRVVFADGSQSIPTNTMRFINSSALTFVTPVATGINNVQLNVSAQLSLPGSPAFNYDYPVLSRITGCSRNVDPKTLDCLPDAVITFTISGNNFGNNESLISIQIGTAACRTPTLLIPHTQLQCIADVFPGSSDELVTVTVDGQTSQRSLVSYLGVQIQQIQCDSGMSNWCESNSSGLFINFNSSLSAPPFTLPSSVSLLVDVYLGDTNSSNMLIRFGQYRPELLSSASQWSRLEYSCDIQSATAQGGQIVRYQCLIGNNVGVNLTFQVAKFYSSVNVWQYSAPQNVSLNYPRPVIIPATIRPPAGTYGQTAYQGVSTQGDIVQFDAFNLGSSPSNLRVFFTFPNATPSANDSACTNIVVNGLTLRCSTPSGSGGPFVFYVVGLNNPSTFGSDTYSYVASPTVTAVSGCETSTTQPEGTVDCPTNGGVTITLQGTLFSLTEPMSVSISSLNCPNVTFLTSNTLTCTLPAGAGLRQGVSVVVGQRFSNLLFRLSYAAPIIDRVSGCRDAGNTTVDCPRNGTATITLFGSNFGATGATVVVNGNSCSNVTHIGPNFHSQVTCRLPAGVARNASVVLVQRGGVMSTRASQLSYQLCAAGTYQPSLTNTSCITCPAGRTSSQGAFECSNCNPGRFAVGGVTCDACVQGYFNNGSFVACQLCTRGFYSLSSASACVQCEVGRYNNQSAVSSCITCLSGTYSANKASTGCTSCLAGAYSGLSGAANCESCSPGFFSPAGSPQCYPCASGSYSDVNNAAECTYCPIGRAVSATGQQSCRFCDSGTFGNATGLAGCEPCAAGSFSNPPPNSGAAVCSQCIAGRYINVQGQTGCLDCPLGSFNNISGASSCALCPSGYFSGANFGATVCDPCLPGNYSTAGSLECKTCTAGTFSLGLTSSCTPCQTGEFQSNGGASECNKCPVGAFTLGTGQTGCSLCDSGSYTNTTGMFSCTKCPKGRYSERGSVGPSVCYDCTPGKFASSEGQSFCLDCAAGYYSVDSASSTCGACVSGTYSPNSAMTDCLNCTKGYFSSISGGITCASCPQGSFSANDAATLCVTCGAGFSAAQSSSTCTACDAGFYTSLSGQGSCLPCPAGSFNNVSAQSSCSRCFVGMYQQEPGKTFCPQCSIGRYNNAAGQTDCVQCSPGSFGPSQALTSCSACLSGTYSDILGGTACLNCPAGFFASSGGAVACDACSLGQFSNLTAQTFCLSCQRGYVQQEVGGTACSACPASTYSSSSSAECLLCAPGRYTETDGQDSCDPCPQGTYALTSGLSICANCSSGSVNNGTGATSCLLCGAGQFAPEEGMRGCQLCPRGTFSANLGQATCTPCQPGTFLSATGQSRCLQCPSGTFSPIFYAQNCSMCEIGRVSLGGVSECADCNQGFFQNARAQAQCLPCQPGTFQDEKGTTTCSSCATGKYSSDSASVVCLSCPIGKFSYSNGSLQCTDCQQGRYNTETGKSECGSCEVGKFQSAVGKTECPQCTPGRFMASTGQTACQSCSEGRFSNVSGASFCSDCLPGFVMSSTGSSSCVPCEIGKFAEFERAATCESCAAGKAAAVQGSSACQECAPGRFQESLKGSWCDACPAGKSSPTPGALRCTDCKAGTFQNLSAMAQCEPCASGSVQPATGQSTCILCAPGTYMQTEGQGQCLDCGPGTYQRFYGQATCNNCPKGTASSGQGSSTCVECTPGRVALNARSERCDVCLAGRFQANYSGLECVECPPGSANKDDGASSCSECLVGQSTSGLGGAKSCDPCTGGLVATKVGSANCRSCQVNAIPNTDQTACLCAVGYVLGEDEQTCELCPRGAKCDLPGTKLSTIETSRGWWRSGNEYVYYKCLLSDHCLGGINSTCLEFRTGPICAFCIPGYQSDAFGTECSKCPAKGMSGFLMALILAGITAALLFMYYLILRKDETERQEYKDVFWKEKEAELLKESGDDDLITNLPVSMRQAIMNSQNAALATSGATDGSPPSMPGSPSHFSQASQQVSPGRPEGQVASALPSPSHAARPLAYPGEHSPLHATTEDGVLLDLDKAGEEDDYVREQEAIDSKHQLGTVDARDKASAPVPVSRGNRVWTIQGIRNKPNFMYKLKILLSFFQVVTNFSFVLEVPWPSGFQSFIRFFNFVNLDFIKWASVGCVVKSDYFLKWRVFVLVPLIITIVLVLGYFVPMWYYNKHDLSDDRTKASKRKTYTRKLVKLIIFTIFLVYPAVSAAVLKLYVCRQVAGTYYLVQDFTIKCSGVWVDYAGLNVLFVLLYPIGVPLLLLYCLYRNRNRLLLPKIRSQFGFLYDAYELQLWWFEIVDMVYKLLMTSMIAFFTPKDQLPAAMAICTAYTMMILVYRPYVRKGDDRLHLFCQVEMFLLVLVAQVVSVEANMTKVTDVLLSILLVSLSVGLILYFLLQATQAARKMWLKRNRERMLLAGAFNSSKKLRKLDVKDDYNEEKEKEEDDERDGAAPKNKQDYLPELVSSLNMGLVDN